MINHGTFTRYTPDIPADNPTRAKYLLDIISVGAIFHKNGSGVDWYDLSKTAGRCVLLGGDQKVRSWSDDPTSIGLIDGCTIIESDDSCDYGFTFNGSTFVKDEILLKKEINSERDRRISGGFIFATNEYQSDPSSRENIAGAQGLSLGAMIADPQGVNGLRWTDPDKDFTWTSAANVEIPMTAAQCQAFCQAAMQYKTELIKAARSLKDLQPIPQDYANDQHWPSRTLD